jgi:hypothetical protein
MALSRWMTRRDNPFFARAAVNRLWDHFFGRGFVSPVDDLDRSNPPVLPELFDLVAGQFVEHQFDLNYLIRAITATRAYQLSSRGAAPREDDPQWFARMALRRLSADQLFDSIVQATGLRDASRQPREGAPGIAPSIRAEFQAKFADQSASRSEAETSILQALSLMNGKLVADATDLESSETLVAVVESPFLDTAGRMEVLFLSTLCRRPEPEELSALSTYVAQTSADRGPKTALADIFWALLNSAEFVFNH